MLAKTLCNKLNVFSKLCISFYLRQCRPCRRPHDVLDVCPNIYLLIMCKNVKYYTLAMKIVFHDIQVQIQKLQTFGKNLKNKKYQKYQKYRIVQKHQKDYQFQKYHNLVLNNIDHQT